LVYKYNFIKGNKILAQQLSSASIPISAAISRGNMYEAMIEQTAKVGIFGHGYTHSGHPVVCAVALKR
jgi:adenosylmethionine-8-amino-7-oxononanoate aminotransferase